MKTLNVVSRYMAHCVAHCNQELQAKWRCLYQSAFDANWLTTLQSRVYTMQSTVQILVHWRNRNDRSFDLIRNNKNRVQNKRALYWLDFRLETGTRQYKRSFLAQYRRLGWLNRREPKHTWCLTDNTVLEGKRGVANEHLRCTGNTKARHRTRHL